MPELTERQRTILLFLIRDYIETAQPVGSKRLVERFRLALSPATVRNEMSALTEMGYLRQPHTSAGRVPTEEGYRVFVGHMMNKAELPESVQNTISHQFFQASPDVDQWMTLAASVLAHQSQGVSLVTAPHAETIRFKHVELISTQGRQVLMVTVMEGGEVKQQILTLAEPVSQTRLTQVATRLNSLLAGLAMDAIATLVIPRRCAGTGYHYAVSSGYEAHLRKCFGRDLYRRTDQRVERTRIRRDRRSPLGNAPV